MSPHTGSILQEEVLPRLRSSIKQVRSVGAEDPEELIQDAVVMAAKMMDRNEQRNKHVTAGNITYYTVAHMRSGRRANGTSCVDIMAAQTQLSGSSTLHSLSEVVSQSEGDEVFELHDVISSDQDDPSVQAARRLDWQTFVSSLSDIECLVVDFLGAGKSVHAIAQFLGACDKTVQVHRNKIGQKLVEFMGIDVLKEATKLPRWKINLDCARESFACRAERRRVDA